jgi:hypothetical protein
VKTMTISEFIAATEAAEFTSVTKKNVLVAVRRILRNMDPSSNFQFDAKGVSILFDLFKDNEERSQELSSRTQQNYQNLFLHAAHQIANTPVEKRYKVVMTLPEV